MNVYIIILIMAIKIEHKLQGVIKIICDKNEIYR